MNPTSFNQDVTKVTSTLNTIAASALAVENMAAQAAAGAATLTGPQKLQIAVGIASAFDPAIAPLGEALAGIFAAVVQGWHLAGVFAPSAAQATPTAEAAPTAQAPAAQTPQAPAAPVAPANYG